MNVWHWATVGIFISLCMLLAALMVLAGIRLVDHDRLTIPQSIIAVCIATNIHFMYALTLPTVARDMRQNYRGMLTFGFDDTPLGEKQARREYVGGDIDLHEFEERIEEDLSEDHDTN